jgi:hypothetical protein
MLANSSGTTLRDAAVEWQLQALPPILEQYISCEACGTPIRRIARIHNKLTGATLIIGLVCYGHLLDELEAKKVPSRLPTVKTFLNTRQAEFARLFHHTYVDYQRDVDIGDWKKWLVEAVAAGAHVPEDVKQGVAELRAYGFLASSELLPGLIKYHDMHRRFPRRVLLPIADYPSLKDVPEALTIEEARALRRGTQKVNVPTIHRKRGAEGHDFPVRHEADRAERGRERRLKALERARDDTVNQEGVESLKDLLRNATSLREISRFNEATSASAPDLEMRALLVVIYGDRQYWQSSHDFQKGDVVWSPSKGFSADSGEVLSREEWVNLSEWYRRGCPMKFKHRRRRG